MRDIYFSPNRYYICKNGRMIFGKRSNSKGKALEYLLNHEGEYVAEEQLRELLGIRSTKSCLYALRIQMSFSNHYKLVMAEDRGKRYHKVLVYLFGTLGLQKHFLFLRVLRVIK